MALTAIHPGLDHPAGLLPDFESLMRQHQSMVFSLAYNFLADRGLAEEVAQDVFLSLYRNLNGIQSPEHASRWLRRVAVQRSIDEARKRKRRPQTPLEDAAEPATPAPSADILEQEALWRLVGSLPEIPRMVVILRYQEDLTTAEIAAALDRPAATVKSDLQRALALLREKSARHFGDNL